MKRATVKLIDESKVKIISIHALVKRATVLHVYNIIRKNISIHALVKRATTRKSR